MYVRQVSNEMNLREKRILFTLINLYIQTAEPIGSRNIARQDNIDVSAATVRNTLSDLERMGYVYQPHTSAGRIPTDVAYRFYVDRMMKLERLRSSEKMRVEDAITGSLKETPSKITDIVEHASRVLAIISKQLGVGLAPKFELGVLNKIHLLPIAEGKVLCVIYLASGLVRTVIMEIESKIRPRDIERVSRILNERLGGISLKEISKSAGMFFRDVAEPERASLNFFIKSANRLFASDVKEKVHVGGASHMLELPEFKERDEVSSLFKLLDDRGRFCDMLRECRTDSEDLSIMIGEENRFEGLQNLSVIVRNYEINDEIGIIGVIGPTRMRYSRIIPLVNHTAHFLSSIFEEFGSRLER